jgi:uncharacterized OsmC-like protein
MPTIETVYQGNLRTLARHLQSGNEIVTDAPVDNRGKGEAFSPTDLLSASLGSCMLTIIGMAAETHGMNINGTRISITKIMASDPRRVAEIQIEFLMPLDIRYNEKQRVILEKAAATCPVALSLHPDIKQTVRFIWS